VVDRDRFSALISKMLAGSYETDTAPDGLQAIKKLSSATPEVVVVDQDIPGNGIRLAELVGLNPKYSQLAIILTSGRPEPDTIIRARNAGISAYLAKPFKPSELVNRIATALATMEAEAAAAPEPEDEAEEEEEEGASADINRRVKSIDGLPPFPATHAEILKLAKSDESSSDDLADKIQLDTGLLATVLKLANSSYYGFARKTDSLTEAVTRLGMEEVANLVMSAQVFQSLGGFEDGETGLDMKAFWQHSVGTAFISRAVAKKLQTEVDAAFLAGMLHDLGKIVLDHFFGEYYGAAVEMAAEGEISIFEAEREVMGTTHAEVGGQLATDWNFSKNFLNTILHHHNPRLARRHNRLVCVVHLGNALCRELKYGSSGDDLEPKIDESVLDRFNLGDRGMQLLRESAAEDLEKAVEDANSFLAGLG
jgi:putative nucleotidyltransferase with HDIG domain